MKVSIVITCLNEEKNIESCLQTLVNQDYSVSDFEIIVSDGGSKDKTQQIVQEFSKKYSNVKLVIELKKGAAAGRNAGIKSANYDYIAFIDGDCEAPTDWLSILVNNFKEYSKNDKKLAAVGGTNIPPKDESDFVKAIGIALDSFLGSFSSAQGRQFKEVKYVESLPNLNVLYDKKKLLEIDCFDESLMSEAEDADLNFRLHKKGYKFLFIPESYVIHKMRPTPKSWYKNMFRYGKGRARLLKRYPEMWKITFVLPLLFLAGVFFLPLLYFPIIFLFSIFQCARKQAINLSFKVFLVYIIQHFGYAFGEFYGLFNSEVK